MNHKDFVEYLTALRSAEISLDQFRETVSKEVFEKHLSNGLALQLRLGQMQNVFVDQIPECESCAGRGYENLSSGGFEILIRHLEGRLEAGVLQRIEKPRWVETGNVLGGEEFFKCSKCGSVWRLVYPERAQRGFYKRLG